MPSCAQAVFTARPLREARIWSTGAVNVQTFAIVLLALAVIVGASLLSRRTGIAAPLLLVALGIGASFVPAVPDVLIEPEWVLAGVLPPLLYASSVKLPVIDFRRNFAMIGWLSVVMVVGTAVAIGLVVHAAFDVPLALGIALGAVVSPTDAVAATSIGKRLGLPHRLMTVLEGESLVNDATALVLLRTATMTVAGGFSLLQALGDFGFAVIVAVAVGALAGVVTVAIRARLNDPVLTTAISFVVPFVAFFPAEELGASGVLAAVVAGLVTGHRGAKRLSARDRQTESTNWATISFLLENAVFLAMGLEVTKLIADLDPELDGSGGLGQAFAIAAVVFGLLVVLRFGGVALPLLLQRLRPLRTSRGRERLAAVTERVEAISTDDARMANRVEGFRRRLARGSADMDFAENERITARGGLVLAWAGMRGVVTLAAAQTIEEQTPFRSVVVLVAFLVAVATLAIFGGTLPWLIRRLNFGEVSFDDRREEFGRLMSNLVDIVRAELGPLEEQEVDGELVDPEAIESLVQRFGPLFAQPGDDAPVPKPGVREQTLVLHRRFVVALRAALLEERSIGAYSSETFALVERILDREETQMDGIR